MCCQCVNQTQMRAANLRSACFFMPLNLSHTLLTPGHFAFVPKTHTTPRMSRTHSPLALGQSSLSTAACRLSLFPCPVGAPVPPPHWVLAPGPAVKRVAPTPPRVEAGGGTPTPITLLRMLLSAALSACPASDRTTKAATATETAAGLVVVMKPFDHRHHAPQAVPQSCLNTHTLLFGTHHYCYS